MNFRDLIETMYDFLIQFMPIFRVFWIISIFVGVVLLVVSATILKKNPERRKSSWIIGGVGFVIIVSSGVQLISSLL